MGLIVTIADKSNPTSLKHISKLDIIYRWGSDPIPTKKSDHDLSDKVLPLEDIII